MSTMSWSSFGGKENDYAFIVDNQTYNYQKSLHIICLYNLKGAFIPILGDKSILKGKFYRIGWFLQPQKFVEELCQ